MVAAFAVVVVVVTIVVECVQYSILLSELRREKLQLRYTLLEVW